MRITLPLFTVLATHDNSVLPLATGDKPLFLLFTSAESADHFAAEYYLPCQRMEFANLSTVCLFIQGHLIAKQMTDIAFALDPHPVKLEKFPTLNVAQLYMSLLDGVELNYDVES
jgi:hypothetical protein